LRALLWSITSFLSVGCFLLVAWGIYLIGDMRGGDMIPGERRGSGESKRGDKLDKRRGDLWGEVAKDLDRAPENADLEE